MRSTPSAPKRTPLAAPAPPAGAQRRLPLSPGVALPGKTAGLRRRRAPKGDVMAFRGTDGLDHRLKRAARELGLAGYGELLRTICERFLRAHECKHRKRDGLLDLADRVRMTLAAGLDDGLLSRAEVEIVTDQIVELVAGVRKRRTA